MAARTNGHLYAIRAGDVGRGMVDLDWAVDGPLDAINTRLLDVIEDVGFETLKYIYDFGDGWVVCRSPADDLIHPNTSSIRLRARSLAA